MTNSVCLLLDNVLLIVVQHLEAGLKLQYTGSMLLGKVLCIQSLIPDKVMVVAGPVLLPFRLL